MNKGSISILAILGIVLALGIVFAAGSSLIPGLLVQGNMVQMSGCHYPAELGGSAWSLQYCGSYAGTKAPCAYDKCRISAYKCGQDPTDPSVMPFWEKTITKGQSVTLPEKSGIGDQYVVLKEFFRCSDEPVKDCSSSYRNNDIRKYCVSNSLVTEKCADGTPVKLHTQSCEYGCVNDACVISEKARLGETCKSNSDCYGGAICDYVYDNPVARKIQPRKVCGGSEKYPVSGCENWCNSDYCYMSELCGKCSVCNDFVPPVSTCEWSGKAYQNKEVITYDCSGGYIIQCDNGVKQTKDKHMLPDIWKSLCGKVTSGCSVQSESCGSSKPCCDLKDEAGNKLICFNDVCQYQNLVKEYFGIGEGDSCNTKEDLCAEGFVCVKSHLLETPIGGLGDVYTCEKGNALSKFFRNLFGDFSITSLLISAAITLLIIIRAPKSTLMTALAVIIGIFTYILMVKFMLWIVIAFIAIIALLIYTPFGAILFRVIGF